MIMKNKKLLVAGICLLVFFVLWMLFSTPIVASIYNNSNHQVTKTTSQQLNESVVFSVVVQEASIRNNLTMDIYFIAHFLREYNETSTIEAVPTAYFVGQSKIYETDISSEFFNDERGSFTIVNFSPLGFENGIYKICVEPVGTEGPIGIAYTGYVLLKDTGGAKIYRWDFPSFQSLSEGYVTEKVELFDTTGTARVRTSQMTFITNSRGQLDLLACDSTGAAGEEGNIYIEVQYQDGGRQIYKSGSPVEIYLSHAKCNWKKVDSMRLLMPYSENGIEYLDISENYRINWEGDIPVLYAVPTETSLPPQTLTDFTQTGLYSDATWDEGMLVVDGWLFSEDWPLAEQRVYVSITHSDGTTQTYIAPTDRKDFVAKATKIEDERCGFHFELESSDDIREVRIYLAHQSGQEVSCAQMMTYVISRGQIKKV